MRWLRAAGLALAVGLATSVGVLGVPASACACGAFLLPTDETVAVSGEHAVIAWDGEHERILLSMDVDASSADAALLIPTPAPATVDVADPAVFPELAAVAAPVVEKVDLWWPEWLVSVDLSNEAPGAQAQAPRAVALGDLDVEVIEAADADRLQEWLHDHDLELRDKVASALVPYIQQGWYFTLITLDTESLTGRVQPLDIRFETNQMVYPLRLSVAGGPLAVDTYLLADHRMERTDTMGGYVTFAGPVTPTDFTNQTLVDLARDHPFLTVWKQNFTDPRQQIDGDMVFAAASSDAEVSQIVLEVVRRDILGMPAGPILVFGGLVLLGVLVVVISRRPRPQRE